ncbi:MAG: hypothetical protein RL352_242 [Actinomycetota bacterium]
MGEKLLDSCCTPPTKQRSGAFAGRPVRLVMMIPTVVSRAIYVPRRWMFTSICANYIIAKEPSDSRFKKWNCAPQRRRSTNTKRIALPTSNPTPCITMNIGTDSGAMPANELLKLRAIDTAGFASDVDEVNQ